MNFRPGLLHYAQVFAATAALLLPNELAAQNAHPPPKELGERSFAGVWVQVQSGFPGGMVVEYAGNLVEITFFLCETPGGSEFLKHYSAKAGTRMGDLCLGHLRPKDPSELDPIQVWETWHLEGRVQGKVIVAHDTRNKGVPRLRLELSSDGTQVKTFYNYYQDNVLEHDFVRAGPPPEKLRASDFDALFGKPKSLAKPTGKRQP